MSGPLENQPLPLSASAWREVLRTELIDRGFEHDIAELIARRVIDRLVGAYLLGRLDDGGPATRSLDEAA